MKHLGIFINNTDSEIKQNININNIEKLKHNFDNIIIIDIKSEYSYILNKYLIDNNNINDIIYKYLLTNIGKDNNDLNIEKLYFVLKDINGDYFDYITVINDNYIYINDLNDYFDYVEKHNLHFCSYTDTTENIYHYQLYLFTFNTSYLNELVDNLSKKTNDITSIFKKKMSYLKLAYLNNNYQQNIYFNDNLYKNLMENNIIHIINLKKLNYIIDNYKCEFFINIPSDFDIEIYKNHPDLKNLSESLLVNHFLNNGQFDPRNYKKNNYILPLYIRNGLLKCNNLINFFDLPSDFNLFEYREKNKDLISLNRSDIIIHYIKNGRKEGRNY